MSHYGAAKAGVIDLTSTLSFEWADDDVRVNCIAPGFVATPGVESQMGVSADNIDRGEVRRSIGTTEKSPISRSSSPVPLLVSRRRDDYRTGRAPNSGNARRVGSCVGFRIDGRFSNRFLQKCKENAPRLDLGVESDNS